MGKKKPTLDEIARLASARMHGKTSPLERKAWERMSEEYRLGWRAMVESVLEALDDGR